MNIGLILSGGTGARLGASLPKQYIQVAGRPVISYCMETLSIHKGIDALQIVADLRWQRQIETWMERYGCGKKLRGFSLPGENRQLSILNGLEDIVGYGSEQDLVLIHDAARPMLSQRQITDCLEAAKGHDGVLPVLPMKDTVYFSEDGRTVASLLDRSRVFAGQAPEVFVLGRYLEANRRLLPDKILTINGSTEPGILAGMNIAMIPGDEGNFKITTQADLRRFEGIVSESEQRAGR